MGSLYVLIRKTGFSEEFNNRDIAASQRPISLANLFILPFFIQYTLKEVVIPVLY